MFSLCFSRKKKKGNIVVSSKRDNVSNTDQGHFFKLENSIREIQETQTFIMMSRICSYVGYNKHKQDIAERMVRQ